MAFMTNLDRALCSKNLTRVFDDLSDVCEAFLDVCDVQAILTSFQRAFVLHGSDIIRHSGDD
jgi:hypothetical protein